MKTLVKTLQHQDDRGPIQGCWEWSGPTVDSGHGQTRFEGQHGLVHRMVWEAYCGEIPEGLVICHSCDNPICFRIDHLFLGTQKENVHDAIRKGRRLPRKLDEGDVDVVRIAVASGEPMRSVARRFHVSHQLISMIVGEKRRTLQLTGGGLP